MKLSIAPSARLSFSLLVACAAQGMSPTRATADDSVYRPSASLGISGRFNLGRGEGSPLFLRSSGAQFYFRSNESASTSKLFLLETMALAMDRQLEGRLGDSFSS